MPIAAGVYGVGGREVVIASVLPGLAGRGGGGGFTLGLAVVSMGLGWGICIENGDQRERGAHPTLRALPPHLALLSPLMMMTWLSKLQAERGQQSETGQRACFPGRGKTADWAGQGRPGGQSTFSADTTTSMLTTTTSVKVQIKLPTNMIFFDAPTKTVR